ncbi:MAG: Stp1/IreP family PP2C-type Ser/Thr phosphatase [Lachnospiraceae bacterium]|nr:Stp1/IreP family PP2C-type Ser/Thr phosphatase [Lachnospiraceae bacterium]
MKTFYMTDIGRMREMNQDYVYTSEEPVGALPNLFLVADGMGGHNAGDYASKFTVETIVSLIPEYKTEDPKEILSRAILDTNRRLYENARRDPALHGTGTTLVALVVYKGKAVVANVGDSRLYVVNNGIRQVTKDHSLVQEMVRRGEMNEREAIHHPDKNIITRAIGAEPEVAIDFFDLRLNRGDQILMCSDGLSNMLDDEEIRQTMERERDPAEKAYKLVEMANENGGRDNITVVVLEEVNEVMDEVG